MGRTHFTASLPPAVTRGRSTQPSCLQKFTTFVSTILTRAEVTPATVLVALVYISRARPHLSIALEQWALERVFLGAIIVASKYTNDSTLQNVHWALCSGVFGKRDIGRIEREFLDVLDWELGVGEADLIAHHEGLLAASRLVETTPVKPTYLTRPRAHTHTRRSAGAIVPELDPSSPQSSLASMSPRTPPSSPAAQPSLRSKPALDVSVYRSASYSPAHHKETVEHGGTFHDLLRAFPMPRSHSYHGGFPIHLAA
ncbi:hypothetical protein B0H19DRAFT_468156 [Mycena capillaripes]|nr:hypothetical protein B0H19DRAFT_468156 [Mycena capillaripes]